MRPIALLRGAVFLVGLTAANSVFATPYDTLSSIAGAYNVFLLGNLGTSASPYASDSQGAVAVAGNAYLTAGPYGGSGGSNPTALVVGGNLTQTNGTDSGNVYVGGNASFANTTVNGNIVVGGSLTQQSGSDGGNVFVGGNATISGGPGISGSINMTGNNATLTAGSGSAPNGGIYVTASATVNDPSYWGAAHVGGGPATPTAPLDVFGSSTDIRNASTSLGNLTGSGATVTTSGNAITITLNQNGLNVVNLSLPSGTTVSGISIVDASGVTATGIVLNITGDNLNFSGGSYSSSALTSSQILYNFKNATNLSLSSMEFVGNLLAPLATVNFSSGDIKGDLIANNFVGNAQFNWGGGFNDPLPAYTAAGSGTVATTPEPGSIVLFGTALAALGLLYRQRKNALAAG